MKILEVNSGPSSTVGIFSACLWYRISAIVVGVYVVVQFLYSTSIFFLADFLWNWSLCVYVKREIAVLVHIAEADKL